MRDDEQLKIELLSQWKLEAEFRNIIQNGLTEQQFVLDTVLYVHVDTDTTAGS